MKIEGKSNLEFKKIKIDKIFSIVRNSSISSADYHFVLFLLSLRRFNCLNKNYFKHDLTIEQFTKKIIEKSERSIPQIEVLISYYYQTINDIEFRIINELIDILNSFDFDVLEQNFSQLFDELLYKLLKTQHRLGGESILPVAISKFINEILDLPSQSKIYNPFAGLVSFGINLSHDHIYIGQEIDRITYIIGQMRLIAYNQNVKSKLCFSDSISDWNPIRRYESNDISDVLSNGSIKEKYDLIISNPPFGIRLPYQINGKFGVIRSYEHFLIENALSDLKPEGKIIAVISQSFLFHSGTERFVRQFLIENDILETVISLPSGLLMNTSVPITIIVINKNKNKKGVVQFIDAKSFVQIEPTGERVLKYNDLAFFIKSKEKADFSKFVKNQTIIDYDFNLSVLRYFKKEYEGFPLRELGTIIRGNNILGEENGKFIRIRNLIDDSTDFLLDSDKVDDTDIPYHCKKIEESCLLIAIRWKTLKPTYFHYKGTPIFINNDILAFNVDQKKCDIGYLVKELNSINVQEQVDAFRIGSIIPSIRKEDLLSVIVSMPGNSENSLLLQKAIVKERLLELREEKKRNLLLFDKIHGLENEILEQNTYLRHTLAGPASNLKGTISSLSKIFFDKITPIYPNILDLKISDQHSFTLKDYLSILERDAEKIVSTVTSQLRIDSGIKEKKLIPINIIQFLNGYSLEKNNGSNFNFKIHFSFDKEVFIDKEGDLIKTFILGNEDLLRELFDNLFDNAVKHAFQDDESNFIEIYLMKAVENEDQDNIQILFSNTGKPFPRDFTINDFIRKGSKFGLNSGDGFGGWYINEIIKRLNGDFDIIDETGLEGLPGTNLVTSFEINFPIVETDENV